MVPFKLLRLHPLLFRGDDVQGHDRQHGAVHRHRDAHLVERDAVEQHPHVVDAVDRHAGHADVAGDARMIGVVAAVRGQIEGDAQAHLAGGQVAAVEGVGILGGREAGVLADRPRPLHVHRGVRPAHERRHAGHGVEMIDALQIGSSVQRLDRNLFGRLPGEAHVVARRGRASVASRSRRDADARVQRHVGKVRNGGSGASFNHSARRLLRGAFRARWPARRT